jgi:hypothetical protein
MKPITRIPATGPIIGWNRVHIDQYVEYLRYPPSIVTNSNWRPDIVNNIDWRSDIITLRNKPTTAAI